MELESSKPLTVLLVEDSIPAQKGAMMFLAHLGYKIDVADNGEKAIALFEPNKYTLVILDIGLPDMQGYQVAERFRSLEKTTNFHVPILAISAHAGKEDQVLAEAAGIDALKPKPVSLEKITSFVAQHAQHSN